MDKPLFSAVGEKEVTQALIRGFAKQDNYLEDIKGLVSSSLPFLFRSAETWLLQTQPSHRVTNRPLE